MVAILRDADEMTRLHRAAEVSARVPRGSLVARELVADVVTDTYRGVLTWTSERKLASHLLEEVRRRAGRMRKSARQHVPLEHLRDTAAPPVDNEDGSGELDVLSLQERVAWAREQIGDDQAAQQLLTLYELGIRRKRDVLALGMQPRAYRRARERLTVLFGAKRVRR